MIELDVVRSGAEKSPLRRLAGRHFEPVILHWRLRGQRAKGKKKKKNRPAAGRFHGGAGLNPTGPHRCWPAAHITSRPAFPPENLSVLSRWQKSNSFTVFPVRLFYQELALRLVWNIFVRFIRLSILYFFFSLNRAPSLSVTHPSSTTISRTKESRISDLWARYLKCFSLSVRVLVAGPPINLGLLLIRLFRPVIYKIYCFLSLHLYWCARRTRSTNWCSEPTPPWSSDPRRGRSNSSKPSPSIRQVTS